MSSANGQADWASDEAYLADLARFIGERTGLRAAHVKAAERAEIIYEAACYRSFGGPILYGHEHVDFEALARKHPDIIPAEGYFTHSSYEDKIVFLVRETSLSSRDAVEYLAAGMAFRRAAGISTSADEDEDSFRRWAKGWLASNKGLHLRLVKNEESER